jgi:hypothetical protein
MTSEEAQGPQVELDTGFFEDRSPFVLDEARRDGSLSRVRRTPPPTSQRAGTTNTDVSNVGAPRWTTEINYPLAARDHQ